MFTRVKIETLLFSLMKICTLSLSVFIGKLQVLYSLKLLSKHRYKTYNYKYLARLTIIHMVNVKPLPLLVAIIICFYKSNDFQRL